MRRIPNELFIQDVFMGKSAHSIFRIVLGLGVVSAVYGGLHASAWNSFFPTQLECYMWRISAIIMPLVGIIASFVAFAASFEYVRSATLRLFDWISKVEKRISTPLRIILFILYMPVGLVIFPLLWAAITSYISSRIYLVVEAFISLRELPIDAYKTPTWTQLIPHL